MKSPPDAPEAGDASMTDTGSNLGNEIGLGNLSAVQHTAPGQVETVLPGNLPATAATVTFLLSCHRANLLAHQANLAAALRSSQVIANGAFEMRRAWTEASAASLKDTNEAVTALASVRCVKDLVDVQSRLVRSTMEKAFARGTQVASDSMKLTHQALEPISSRISASTRAFVSAG